MSSAYFDYRVNALTAVTDIVCASIALNPSTAESRTYT